MRSIREGRRKLAVRRETLLGLATLGPRQLARVAGGSGGGVDPDDRPHSWDCWSDSATMSTGSRFC